MESSYWVRSRIWWAVVLVRPSPSWDISPVLPCGIIFFKWQKFGTWQCCVECLPVLATSSYGQTSWMEFMEIWKYRIYCGLYRLSVLCVFIIWHLKVNGISGHTYFISHLVCLPACLFVCLPVSSLFWSREQLVKPWQSVTHTLCHWMPPHC